MIAEQRAYFKEFATFASAEQKALLASTVRGPNVDEVNRMEAIAIESPQAGNTGDADATKWYAAMTAKIDLLKQVEDNLSTSLRARTGELRAAANRSFAIIVALTLLPLLLGGAIVFVTVRGVAHALNVMAAAMTRLANGDTGVHIPASGQHNEIGQMASAVQIFRENAVNRLRLEAEREREQAAQLERQKKIDATIAEFREQVHAVLQAFAAETRKMETTAETLSAMAGKAAPRPRMRSAHPKGLGAGHGRGFASEQLAGAIKEIARQIGQTKGVASEAADAAQASDARMAELAEAARKIGEVISLINSIAGQTNLLALNATIEAARAGEAGKGFSVVAAVVKELADQTAKATENISEHIQSIQSQADLALQAIRKISQTMNAVSTSTEAIAAAADQQNSCTQEINNNVHQAAEGAREACKNVESLNEAAGRTCSQQAPC